MSLIPFAVRICTVRAFQAVMPSSVIVVDSPQEPIDLLDTKEPKPIIAVYTGSVATKYEGRNLLGGMPYLCVTVQVMLPETFTFSLSNNQTLTIDTRSQGAETALDVLWRIGALALNSGDEPWANLWREFVLKVPQIRNSSYLIERSGVRVTAREVSIDCEPLHEPVLGGEPILAWATLIDLMRNDTKGDGLSALADWVESEIRNGPDRPQTTRDAAYLGLSQYVASALRIEVNPQSVNDVYDGESWTEAPADPDYS